jgi:anti-anti-sigma factor
MSDLNIQVQECKEIPHGAVVALSGSIDAKTVMSFQNQLNAVKNRGISRFILDMEQVRYVNSTGLGYLINLADSVQPHGGGIALVRVQPKVKVVFDMLGLNAFFRIFNSRKEAIEGFPAVGAAEAAAPAAPESAHAVHAAPSPAAPAARPAAAAVASHPKVDTASASTVTCGGCRVPLVVSTAGTYKCPRCAAVFNYHGDGKASFLPRKKPMPVELSLNAAAECRDGLAHFVGILARRVGLSDDLVQCVSEAVIDSVDHIIESAYGGDATAVYHVLLVASDSQLEIRLADHGKSLRLGASNARGQELFSLARQVMDSFDLRAHPHGGNVITMVKKAAR